jgi:hypothetical protein
MKKLSGFLILVLFFCFSAFAFAQTQDKGLIYLDAGEESFGGVYYPASKGETKSHLWYSYKNILSASYATKAQFYTAFDTVWPISMGTAYPGDKYLPIGRWFVPIVRDRPKPSPTVTEIKRVLESNIGEINNTISFGIENLRLENDFTINAVLAGILTLKEENTAQEQSVSEFAVSVDGLGGKVDVLRQMLDEKFAYLKQDGANSNLLLGEQINNLEAKLIVEQEAVKSRLQRVIDTQEVLVVQQQGNDSNSLLLSEQINSFQAKLIAEQEMVEIKLQKIIDAQKVLILHLRKHDEELSLQNEVIDARFVTLKNAQDVRHRFEMVILVLLIILVLLNFIQFFLKYWDGHL